MNRAFRRVRRAAFAVAALLGAVSARAQEAVLTRHEDLLRLGWHKSETLLQPANVRVAQFGKLYSRPVDGEIYVQPLYVPGVEIPRKGVRNVVYVATAHNTVYAFDADSNAGENARPLWQVSLGPSVPSFGVVWSSNLPVEVGVIGTPVIDAATQTMYVVSKNYLRRQIAFRLHALDIRTGASRPGSPVTVQAKAPGKADGGETVRFRAEMQNQRPALTLANGRLYVGFSSVEDRSPYHGWVLAYDPGTLRQLSVHCNTPDGDMGGIWMSGDGFTVDASGNLYYVGGNGSYDGRTNFGESVVKLSPELGLSDWFTPFDFDFLNSIDYDLSSANILGLPGTRLVAAGAKNGKVYLLDSHNLGKWQAGSDSQIVQWFQASLGHIHSSMVYFDSPEKGPLLYVWGENDFLKAWSFDGKSFNTTPLAQSLMKVAPGYANGPGMTVSSNGRTAGSGVLWANLPKEDAVWKHAPGILRAFDAADVTRELWNSDQAPARDGVGVWSKWCPPTVANGRVYLATFSQELAVYGLNPPPPPPAQGRRIGINFGPALSDDQVAGVQPQAHWNSPGYMPYGTLENLKDDSGGVTAASVAFGCDRLWQLPLEDVGGHTRLMRGYLDAASASAVTTVAVRGLDKPYTTGGYDVYVYADGDNGGADRKGVYTIGAASLELTDPAGANFRGAYIQGNGGRGNFVVFRNLDAAEFVLAAKPAGASDRSPVNGIQIVAHDGVLLTGTLELEGIVPTAAAQPIRFEFRGTDSDRVLFGRTVQVAPDGAFRLAGIPPGKYRVRIKGARYLARVVPADLSVQKPAPLRARLRVGDIDRDNRVGARDLWIIAQALGTQAAQADLNGDGQVNAVDRALCVNNQGLVGDP